MATASLTEADLRMGDAVMNQLDWDLEVDTSAGVVVAKDGVVTHTAFTPPSSESDRLDEICGLFSKTYINEVGW